MADLSITATQIVPSTNAGYIEHGIAGEAITAGQPVYRKAADGKFYKAQCDTTAAEAACAGIAISGAVAAGLGLSIQKGATITLGAGASIGRGTVYALSAAAGAICPEADIASTQFVTIIGVGNETNGIVMPTTGPFASGVAHV